MTQMNGYCQQLFHGTQAMYGPNLKWNYDEFNFYYNYSAWSSYLFTTRHYWARRFRVYVYWWTDKLHTVKENDPTQNKSFHCFRALIVLTHLSEFFRKMIQMCLIQENQVIKKSRTLKLSPCPNYVKYFNSILNEENVKYFF